MNYEQIIQAKVNYYHADAMIGIWFGLIFVGIAIAFNLTILIDRMIRGRIYDSWRSFGFVLSIVSLFLGVISFLSAGYEYKMAETKARAEAANYQLIELSKP